MAMATMMRPYMLPLVAFVGTALSWWFAMNSQGGPWAARSILLGGMAASWMACYASSKDRALALEAHRPKAGDPTKGIAAAMLVAALIWALSSAGALRSLVPQFHYVAATLRLVGFASTASENIGGTPMAQIAEIVTLFVYALAFEGIWRGFSLLSLEEALGSKRAEVAVGLLSVLAIVPSACAFLGGAQKSFVFVMFWPLVHVAAAVCAGVLVRRTGRIIPGAIALGMILVLVLSPARQAMSNPEVVAIG